jgi:hypothetical protein
VSVVKGSQGKWEQGKRKQIRLLREPEERKGRKIKSVEKSGLLTTTLSALVHIPFH